MADTPLYTIRLSGAGQRDPIDFDLAPEAEDRAAIARDLGIEGIRKLRFAGKLLPTGRRDWRLEAELGATAVQACVVTLEPVTTRIDAPVLRRYLEDTGPEPTAGEVEMPEDDSIEPLPNAVDLRTVMTEALSLSLPDFPRAPGIELPETVVTEEGAEPLTEDKMRPFAGLAALKDRLGGEDDKG
ncbi:YceD family protein [Pseudoroseicyclus aestuarii]|uniref:Uncharacterized metal-binding protein YceD (DUF177 family) n=1 Tax=Pseudoroseicyclus aestuarii TaxID=1795041 RepID=A0A318SQT2_9RHOB|nr:DUF177 domain-containing protein [Pseudoroseicyclus aestuarii]PYE84002.1 uncharacterized metal-binding protein YceD (DUF177 family) [Pseudoroseicyclus aestuarii]